MPRHLPHYCKAFGHEGSLADVEAAWDAEVERRLAAYDRGELLALDGEAVLAKARRLGRADGRRKLG
jgi:Putative addiction module component